MAPSAAAPEMRDLVPAPELAAAPQAPRLEVGAADDRYERAADRTAEEVVRRLAASGELGGEHSGCSPGHRHAAPVGPEGGAVDGGTAERIRSSAGSPLPGQVRRVMEGAMGADLGEVRLHTGPQAASLSAELGAQAFTVGKDVFLGAGVPDLGSRQGQHLLAHELAHTQQDGGSAQRKVRRLATGTPPPSLVGLVKGAKDTGLQQDTPGAATSRDTAGDVLGHMDTVGGSTGALGEPGGQNDFYTAHDDAAGRKGDQRAGLLGSSKTQNDLTYANSAFSTFSFLVSGAQAIMVFTDAESTVEARLDAAFGLGSGIANTASTLGGVAKTAKGGDEADAVTKAASSVLGEIAGIAGTITKAYELIKKIIAIIKDQGEGTPTQKAVDLVGGVVELAKSVMETINAFLSHLGGITGPMLNAVPGLGVALGAIELLKSGLSIGVSYMDWKPMREQKGQAKAAIWALIGKKGGKTFWGGNESAEEEAALIQAGKWKELAALPGIDAAQKKVLEGDQNSEAFKTLQAKLVKAADDYVSTRLLQLVTAKRIRRQVLNIATTLPGIAGDIAMLTGVGAGVGAGLKAAGSASKGLAGLFRAGKQLVRDHLLTDDKKSTKAKTAAYDKLITSLVNQAVVADSLTGPEKDAEAGRIEMRIKASGVDVKAFKEHGEAVTKASGDQAKIAELGKKLWKSWIEALRKRDG